uniref:PARP catalytic domain-containing protein n=1 Tax=Amphora coffeiformis TaxID=265554 RepID=A0A7S3L720_9STRA|mmetsp:Transcript_11326/g.21602  ORF Transcript_11326/g.21602 Transcript_11326/m.21602 type:complete len:487 (+) Transcript_11326:28-1488(+)|eukprot:scaffold34602_cov216-Amphora_coffeaeformis.AAC.1
MSIPSVECSGTSYSLHLSELNGAKLTNEQWLQQVQDHCSSLDFLQFCERAGIQGPQFEWHNAGHDLMERFFAACRAKSNTDQSAAVVFHGTAIANVNSILKFGLDPNKRRGQAFGPGEYFGKNPGTSSGYCKGSKNMCVFFVIVPPAPMEHETTSSSPLRNCPFEYLVVENNDSQLPIGTLNFSSVDAQALAASQQSRYSLQRLNIEALEKEKVAKLAATKARVIQLIIQRELELAGKVYNDHKSRFSMACKKEIAMYAYEGYDEEFISFFFDGGLPKPNQGLANQEFHSSKTQTVESLNQDWHDAVSKLDKVAAGGNDTLTFFQQQLPSANPRPLYGRSGAQQYAPANPGPLYQNFRAPNSANQLAGSTPKKRHFQPDVADEEFVISSGHSRLESLSTFWPSYMDEDEMPNPNSTDENGKSVPMEPSPMEAVESKVAVSEQVPVQCKSKVWGATLSNSTEPASQSSKCDDEESSYQYSTDEDVLN